MKPSAEAVLDPVMQSPISADAADDASAASEQSVTAEVDPAEVERAPEEHTPPGATSAPQVSVGGHPRMLLQAAEELRRAERAEDALALYQRSLELEPTAEAGAGLVAALRQLGRMDQAAARLAELVAAFPDDQTLLTEGAWLRVARDLKPQLERGLVTNAALLAEQLLTECSAPSLRRHVVFAVIRAAKQRKRWELVSLFCDLIDPGQLSTSPRGKDPSAWSDQARWYAAKAAALVHTGALQRALTVSSDGAARFPRQRQQFQRWHAQALLRLERHQDSVALYQRLCRGQRPSWWLLAEYGQALHAGDDATAALPVLCRAARGCSRAEMGVRLFQDLAQVALELGQRELAANSADLALQIRQRQGWRVPAELCALRAAAGPIDAMVEKERLQRCRVLWGERCGIDADSSGPEQGSGGQDRRERHAGQDNADSPDAMSQRRSGRLIHPDPRRPFCFLRAGRDTVFCLAADLPEGAADGDLLSFRLVPSFDAKKQKRSVRAVELRAAHAGAVA